MLKYPPEELDYFKLVKAAKKTSEGQSFKKVLRVAILADFASQQLSVLLKVLARKSGYDLELYEGAYDAMELEVFNQNSMLYQFKPDFVLLMPTTEKLKSRFHFFAPHEKTRIDEVVSHYKSLWTALKANSNATLVQSNFLVPYERVFGNYDNLVEGSFTHFVTGLNHELTKSGREFGSVLINDVEYLASYVGKKNWIDEKLWILAKAPCALASLPMLAQNLIDILVSSVGENIKCVVLDLDNTMWGGVIGDDGVEGIQLGDLDGEAFVSFQRFMHSLKMRGIILAVCSQNEYSNALKPFLQHPHMVLKESDIAVFIANWDNKADNLRVIQKTLNIGFDSMVFLDDNPFERNLVRKMLPQVIVPELPEDPAQYLRALCELNLFEATTYSETDLQRTDMYRVEAQRESLKKQFSSIEDYLKSLDMVIKLERFNDFNLPRIAQLIQRSNQFNLTTRRYSQKECEAFMRDEAASFPFSLSIRDKFGDYGLISVVILKVVSETVEIDEYLMSCRVLQRGVENFTMNAIFEYAKKVGAKKVTGKFIKSEKNAMVANFYHQFGFKKVSESTDGESCWSCDVSAYKNKPAFMKSEE